MLSLQHLHGHPQVGPTVVPGVAASSPASSQFGSSNGALTGGAVTPMGSMFPSTSTGDLLVNNNAFKANGMDMQLRAALLSSSSRAPFSPDMVSEQPDQCLIPPPPAAPSAAMGDAESRSRQFQPAFPPPMMPAGYPMWNSPAMAARNPNFAPLAFPQAPGPAGQFPSLLGAVSNPALMMMMMNMFPRAQQMHQQSNGMMEQQPSSSSPLSVASSWSAPAQERVKLPSRKRSSVSTLTAVSNSSSEEEDADSVVAPRTTKREKLISFASEHSDETSEMGLGGESRLKINFANLGNPGKHPQVFGKSRLGVPDGLSGTYVLYSERWRSDIVHEAGSEFQSEDGTKHVLITWKITNLTSGVTQSRTETPREALLRHKDGRTLCNKVFRKALEHRATELENDVKSETNPIRAKTMKNLIKKLRPKHFSEGPLVFGLRHECVQNRFKSMTFFDGQGLLQSKQ